jgi:hypothetical protein
MGRVREPRPPRSRGALPVGCTAVCTEMRRGRTNPQTATRCNRKTPSCTGSMPMHSSLRPTPPRAAHRRCGTRRGPTRARLMMARPPRTIAAVPRPHRVLLHPSRDEQQHRQGHQGRTVGTFAVEQHGQRGGVQSHRLRVGAQRRKLEAAAFAAFVTHPEIGPRSQQEILPRSARRPGKTRR